MRLAAFAFVLLALPLLGCGARSTLGLGTSAQHDAGTGGDAAWDSGAIDFPRGTFTDCAMGEHNPDGAVMNVSGFEPGATLELAGSGAAVTATFTDFNGHTSSFDFVPTTPRSAILAHNAQVKGGFTALCVHGVGVSNEEPFPATLEATDGALTYDRGTVFLTTAGTLSADTGTCGKLSVPGAFWVACRQGPAAPPAGSRPPAPVPALPIGNYACTSQIDTLYESGGQTQIVTSGGDGGMLVLSRTGAHVTAEYSDKFISGTLDLGVTSATTAIAYSNQSLITTCEVPIGIPGPPPPPTPETLPITAASLSLDASTLFLSFAGTMGTGSTCNGAEKSGNLICERQ